MQFVYLLPENHAIHSCLPRALVVESLEWLATNLSVFNTFRRRHGDNFWATNQEFKYLGILPIDNAKKRKAYLIILINWIWYMKRAQLERRNDKHNASNTCHRHHHHRHRRRHKICNSDTTSKMPSEINQDQGDTGGNTTSIATASATTIGSLSRRVSVYNRRELQCQIDEQNRWDTSSSGSSSSGSSSSSSGGTDQSTPSSSRSQQGQDMGHDRGSIASSASSTISTTRANEMISDMVTQLEIPSSADIPDWTCV